MAPRPTFVVSDCIGREWQLGTVQLDYNLPSTERFALEYIGADNQPHRPVMIHRAPLGSLERFIGVLIEHFAGAFPLWLAPEQVRVLAVSQKFEEYARDVEARLRAGRLPRDGRLSAGKDRLEDSRRPIEADSLHVDRRGREMESGAVAVRDRIEGDLGSLPLAAAIEKLEAEVAVAGGPAGGQPRSRRPRSSSRWARRMNTDGSGQKKELDVRD